MLWIEGLLVSASLGRATDDSPCAVRLRRCRDQQISANRVYALNVWNWGKREPLQAISAAPFLFEASGLSSAIRYIKGDSGFDSCIQPRCFAAGEVAYLLKHP
jgi:hypothetical protein